VFELRRMSYNRKGSTKDKEERKDKEGMRKWKTRRGRERKMANP
jgi:hypothetical protein